YHLAVAGGCGAKIQSSNRLRTHPLPRGGTDCIQVTAVLLADSWSARKKRESEKSAIMAEITAAAVKQLREKTGAGMMECKNALVEAGGDENKAIDILRE